MDLHVTTFNPPSRSERPAPVRSTEAVTAGPNKLAILEADAVHGQARARAPHADDGLRRADGVLADALGGRGRRRRQLKDQAGRLECFDLALFNVEVWGLDEVHGEVVV